MEIHHGKHHQTYISKLNDALEGHADLASKTIDELIADIPSLPESIRGAVRNNGGGHWNHSFFWKILGPGSGSAPLGTLAKAIEEKFGSYSDFQSKFETAGATRFGSGWAWLCVNADKSLCVCSSPNQDNPLMGGIAECAGTPILGVDVWEHAYYLNYQNRRPDYLKAFWNVVNWDAVEANYQAAMA
jgi:Fe-Mn family superoxide dismutase